jgi:hypothetical protein
LYVEKAHGTVPEGRHSCIQKMASGYDAGYQGCFRQPKEEKAVCHKKSRLLRPGY